LTYQGEVRLQAADQAIAEWDDSLGKGIERYAGTFITRGCSNPERAILFLQFLKSDEGAKLTRWGLEKEQYTLDENGLLVYNKDCQQSNKLLYDANVNEDAVGRNKGINYWNFVDNSWVAGILDGSPIAYVSNKKTLAMRQAVIQAGISYKKYLAKNKNPVFSFAWPNADSPDDQKIKAIQARWEEGALAIITQSTNDLDVEAAWDKLVVELTSMGLDAMEDNMTVRFVDALKRYQAAGYFTDIQP
jgi:putative aldouronate transport system substrate-binding protein